MTWNEIVEIIKEKNCLFNRPGLKHIDGNIECLAPIIVHREKGILDIFIIWKDESKESKEKNVVTSYTLTEEDKKADDWYLYDMG